MHEHGSPGDVCGVQALDVTQTEREAMKRRRDALQAEAVQALMEEYLPQP